MCKLHHKITMASAYLRLKIILLRYFSNQLSEIHMRITFQLNCNFVLVKKIILSVVSSCGNVLKIFKNEDEKTTPGRIML